MTLVEILEQLPYDYPVEIRATTGTAVYTDKAGMLLEDHPKAINLDDFELVSEITLPGQPGGTLAELMAEEIEPIRFVIEGLIPEGLTMLAGKPKLGKSWLALAISLAICAGRDALDHPTVEGETLYLSLEDGKRRMQDRVRILGGQHLGAALERFHYRTDWLPLSNGGVDMLDTWMADHPDTRLVVVDTYGKIRGELPGKDRYTEEYNQLGALQNFATKHRLAVILVHHLRKQGADDWLEQLSGTQAITGAADTLLGLFRERGQMDATLRLVSREVDEKDLALRFDRGRWESMGDAELYRQTVERTEVLEALRDLGGEAKVSDIASLVDKKVGTVSRLLIMLDGEGWVRPTRYGFYQLARTLTDSTDSTTSTEPSPPPITPPLEVVEDGEVEEESSTGSMGESKGPDQRPLEVVEVPPCSLCGISSGRHAASCPENPEW